MTTINGTEGNDLFRITDNPDGADEFFLGGGNDFVFANIGADSYFGGAGLDSVSYRFASAAVALNLSTGGTGGIAAGDLYDSIERIFGSNFDDTITGSANFDFLYGGAGADTLNGAGGNDRLFGQDGDDTLLGGAGNDYIEGGAGADFIDGGAGIDTVGFTTATEGVIVSLAERVPGDDDVLREAAPLDQNMDLQAQGDIYVNIENISGSSFDDTLEGNDEANVINGRAGDDNIIGGLGNDRLLGGLGSDALFGGEGNDNIQGGAGDDIIFGGAGNDVIFVGDGGDIAEGGDGNDFFYLTNDGEFDEIYGGTFDLETEALIDTGFDTVSYIQATAGVEIYIGGLFLIVPIDPTEPLSGEPLETDLNMTVPEDDLLIGIERIIGSNFDDIIFGGFEDEVIIGGNGNDILWGGQGRDRLIGGEGNDTFEFDIGFSDTDSILDFVQGVDTIVFYTSDESLTEADILATVMDYGGVFVFELGPSGFTDAAQRLAVVSSDPDMVLTVDDFSIVVFEDFPDDPATVQEPLGEDFTGQNLAADDVVFFEFDALI